MKTTLDPFHGSRGVLQTIGFTGNPRGVKVRCKQVHNRHRLLEAKLNSVTVYHCQLCASSLYSK